MIKVCEHCSNIDVVQLKKAVGEENVEVTCIGNCAAYKTEAYGYVNDQLIVEDNQDDWIKKVSS
jgi:hypothetical protein